MPRISRLDAPGVIHHIIIRGIERRNIFRDDRDRDRLLERLSVLLPETNTSCYAWVLLSNHAHFLFRTGIVGISTLMRRLLTGYAVGFNHRHRRHGQLFQNRYKSIICQEDTYLRELVRYIHLNPLRAHIVSEIRELDRYPYSGHSVVMGKLQHDWQDVGYVLSYFGKAIREARRRYRAYIAEGLDQGRRDDLVGGGLIRSLGGWVEAAKIRMEGVKRIKADERILGDSAFVDRVLSASEERYERRYELKRRGYDLDRVVARAADLYQMDPGDIVIRGRQRRRVDARSLVSYWAVQELGMTITDLARRFEMSPSADTYAVQRGEAIARNNNYQLLDEVIE
jgi:putative transposase